MFTLQVDLPNKLGMIEKILCTAVVTKGTTTTVSIKDVANTFSFTGVFLNSPLTTGKGLMRLTNYGRTRLLKNGVKMNKFYTLQTTEGTLVNNLTVTLSGPPRKVGYTLAKNTVTLKSIGMVTRTVTNEAIKALQTGVSVLHLPVIAL